MNAWPAKTTRHLVAAAIAALLVACGGGGGGGTTSGGGGTGSGGGTNAAKGATFSYGPASRSPGMVTSLILGKMKLMMEASGSGGTTGDAAFVAADYAGFAGTLLGLLGTAGTALSGGHTAALEAASAAAGDPIFVDESCISGTTTIPVAITFANCEVVTGPATVSGSFDVSSPGEATWDLTIVIEVTEEGMAARTDVHVSGHASATATSFAEECLLSSQGSTTNGGTTYTSGVDESFVYDVALSDSCATYGIGGTMEYKSVFTTRPPGVDATALPDQAVLWTFTGCASADLQYGE